MNRVPAGEFFDAGAFTGNLWLRRVTRNFVQLTVALMLLAIAVALGSGLI